MRQCVVVLLLICCFFSTAVTNIRLKGRAACLSQLKQVGKEVSETNVKALNTQLNFKYYAVANIICFPKIILLKY